MTLNVPRIKMFSGFRIKINNGLSKLLCPYKMYLRVGEDFHEEKETSPPVYTKYVVRYEDRCTEFLTKLERGDFSAKEITVKTH